MRLVVTAILLETMKDNLIRNRILSSEGGSKSITGMQSIELDEIETGADRISLE